MKAPARPGTAARRPVAPRAPKSLVKVLEDDSQKWKASRSRPGDVLARMRSATPAVVPGIKREASEPLGLDRIPGGNISLKERSANVVAKSISRASADVKAQKKAEEAKQIEEAISGIRKPNRSLIGRAIIEDAEKCTGPSSSPHPKKQRKPTRNAPAAARAQVKATPANYRFKDVVSGDARNHGSFNAPLPRVGPDIQPSSSSVIPNTAPRKPFRDDLRDDLAAFHIANTPAAARRVMAQAAKPRPDESCIPESSPIAARKTAPALHGYLTIPRATGDMAPSSPILPRISETPTKRHVTQLPPKFDGEIITSTPPEPRAKQVFVTPAKNAPALTSVAVAASNSTRINYVAASRNIFQQMGCEDDDFDALF